MKFRKKPVVIEARQIDIDGTNVMEIVNWIGASASPSSEPQSLLPAVSIRTLEGIMRADAEDWVIKGVQGEFYPCKPDIFKATYEAV